MDYRKLGRTGLEVSVMGLGTGGASRIGQRTGRSVEESITIIRRALDLGVNFIDTAEAYRTEAIVGRAIAEAVRAGADRSKLVVNSKKSIRQDGQMISAAQFHDGLDAALARLQIDCIDVYHLHGVPDALYDRCVEELVPAMLTARDQGKIRHLGITEGFASDTRHLMLRRAVNDPCWDVMMVGFNLLNQSARETVLQPAMKRNIGILDMFAVRRALSRPEELNAVVAKLIREGAIAADAIDPQRPLGFLLDEKHAPTAADAAYRFCRDEPGIHVVLSGTGDIAHLEENVRSLEAPALPQSVRDRLVALFDGVDSVSGQ